MHISAGGAGQGGKEVPPQIRTVVVYDASSGRIIHTHHAVTFHGGKSWSDDELKARALKLAHEALSGSGRKIPSRLEALHVDQSSVKAGVDYGVDPKRRTLVAGRPISSFVNEFSRSGGQKKTKRN